jgi:hypothetical protein
MKPPRIRTGKAKTQPPRKKPARKFPQKPTARQVAAGNRAALVGVVR